MTPLSELLNEALLKKLCAAVDRGDFPGIDLRLALEFIKTDGVLPASGLPVRSFLDLEDWVRAESAE